MDFLELWDYIVPCILIFYGYRWLTSPPEFGSRKGLTTKYAKKSEENWRMAHSFGGKLGIIYGVIMLAMAVGKSLIKDDALLYTVIPGMLAANLILIFSLVPLVNMYIKKRSK